MKKFTVLAVVVISLFTLIMAGVLWWVIHTYFETGKPTVRLSRSFRAVGQSQVLDVVCSDANSGIRSVSITVIQDNKVRPLASVAYPKRGMVREKAFSVTINPSALNLHDGAAKLRIAVADFSVLKNEGLMEQPFTVDSRPPLVFLMNPVNNVNAGGAGVIVYKTSEPVSRTGVQTGDAFFPAALIALSGKPAYICYFALPVNADKSKGSIKVTAQDDAGNQSFASLPFVLKSKKFRSDKMTLSDNFLQQKMPEFESSYPSLKGKTPLEIFQSVNAQMRLQNEDFIRSLCRPVTPKQLWRDAFLRMKNASPMALFGDRRTYLYQGKSVGESVHLGVDLASTAHAPIEAANNGTVVFTGMLGIYGNAVLIDHGLGLYSLYGHCSDITAKKGQSVKKGEAIAVSGTTGLAAGDHLHFSIIVGGQFVNPQEWWDQHWIADNVYKKMEVSP